MSTDFDQRREGSLELEASATGSPRVVILCKPGASPDDELCDWLVGRLSREGLSLSADRSASSGVDWARRIEREIRTADFVVPLLSVESVGSDLIEVEVEIAHETAQSQRGRPRILPVRVNFTGRLPEPLAGILDPIQHQLWQTVQDNDRVAEGLLSAIRQAQVKPVAAATPGKLVMIPKPLPAPEPRKEAPPPGIGMLQSPGGAVPVNSPFYVVRAADVELRNAVSRRDSVILIKGARQVGKTSLLARGLNYARGNKARVAFTDFQRFNADNFESVANLQFSLAQSLAEQLDLPVLPSDVWDDRRGPNVNFERYLRREVLARIDGHLAWGLDEVDRLFAYPYASEVFGLFRSWHNERALDPTGPWARLTLAIAYATEAHLFITDVNQSPFNIGTKLTLDDFRPDQVADLNKLYGEPLHDKTQLDRFYRLVGGHPYLVSRGLYEMSRRKITIVALEDKAARDDGIYGDHLRRILVLLARDAALTDVVREVLRGQVCSTPEAFYRLRSAGIMKGTSQSDIKPRCQLYAAYLSEHLLGAGWTPPV